MDTDEPIQVWLESSATARASIIVPHVKSATEQDLDYRIVTTREGASGRTSIGQSGVITVRPGQPAALAQLVIRRTEGDRCQISLVLLDANRSEHHFKFLCPGDESNEHSARL